MQLWLRWLYGGFLLVSGLLALTILPGPSIDTSLSDVTPRTIQRDGTAAATRALQANIESRVLFLISASSEQNVEGADDALREALQQIPEVHLHSSNEEFLFDLVEKLKPYRFALLSAQQRIELDSLSSDQIAQQAYEKIVGFNAELRLYPFNEDPLGWQSRALLELLPLEQTSTGTQVNHRVVGLSINRDAMDMRTQAALTSQLDTRLESIARQHQVSIDKSGVFFFAADAASSARKDISLISSVGSVGVIVLLLLAFASLRALVLPVISVLIGVTCAAIFTHAMYGSIHILTIVFGASLIGIAIDYALHFMVHRHLSGHDSTASKPLYRALSLSLATSVVGYAALGLAGVEALEKVAVFSCVGLLMAWLTVVCLGPALLRRDTKQARVLVAGSRALQSLTSRFSIRLSLVLSLFLCVLGVWITAQDHSFSDDPRIFFNASDELLQSERRVAAQASDFEPGRYIIISGQDSRQVYARHAQLMQELKSQQLFNESDFSSLPHWLPSQQQQVKDYRRQQKLYSLQGAMGQLAQRLDAQTLAENIVQEYQESANKTLGAGELASHLADVLPPFWFENPDGSVLSFILIRKGLNADQIAAVTHALPGVEYVNSLQRTSEALFTQRTSALNYLFIAMILIGCLLILRYRAWRPLSLLLVPISAVFGFVAICGLLSIPINLFHVMALFLVLGFGMDYVIFVYEMRTQPPAALQAILLSALTSLLSFGLLSLSKIPVVSSFGLTLLIGNLINLLGAFILSQQLENSLKNK